jgi:putative aldouronate transport system permease protein
VLSIQATAGERAFKVFAIVVLTILTTCAFLPFVLIFVTSFTEEGAIVENGYRFITDRLSLDAYVFMAAQSSVIVRAYIVSIGVTAVGTAVSMLITTMLAYPLSRADFKYRNVLSFLVFFTLLFSGGVVPSYIMWTRLFHLRDTFFALVIPNFLMNGFNVLLVRNYYKNSIPSALIESAQIDGAGEYRIFFRIMIPLSVPVSVTISLFTGLAYWNDWINALYYISKPQMFGIQNLLMRMMTNLQFLTSGQAAGMVNTGSVDLPTNAVRMAMAVIGILPVIIGYPFLQKYLTKGIVIGAIKG